MVRDQFLEPEGLRNSSDWTAEQHIARNGFSIEADEQFNCLAGFEATMLNRNSVFWAAFWTGLAGPASVYAAPATYYAYMGNYSLPLSFAQVGMALGHSYSQVINDGQSIDTDASGALPAVTA